MTAAGNCCFVPQERKYSAVRVARIRQYYAVLVICIRDAVYECLYNTTVVLPRSCQYSNGTPVNLLYFLGIIRRTPYEVQQNEVEEHL